MKWFIGVLAVLVLVLQYRIWLSPHGAREVLQFSSAVENQIAENRQLAARNRQLAAEVRDLRHGYAAMEERARSGLGLILPNETYYQVVSRPAYPAEPVPEPAPLSTTALAAR
jgi:cell division protein FtsB